VAGSWETPTRECWTSWHRKQQTCCVLWAIILRKGVADISSRCARYDITLDLRCKVVISRSERRRFTPGNAVRPTLAAVSGTHRFQVSCAHLPMPAWPGATVSFRSYPERRRFQPSPSPVVVILAACDPTYTAVHCWWSCISGCRKLTLEQSAARRHLSFNADCFSKPPQNLSLFPIIPFRTVFGL